MLPTIERCWFVGIRMFLRRRKCAVWRSSDYMRWNDCFKEERAAVTVQARGIVYHTPPSKGKSTIMVSLSFHRVSMLPRPFYRWVIIFWSCKCGAFEHELPRIFRHGSGSETETERYSANIRVFHPLDLPQMRRDALFRPHGFCSWSWDGFSICHFFRTIVRAIPYSSRALALEPEIEILAVDFSKLLAGLC